MVQLRKKGPPHVNENSLLIPVPEPLPAGRWMGIVVGKIFPSGTGLEDPQDTLEDTAIVRRRTSSLGFGYRFRQQWFDLGPLFVGHHRFAYAHRITSEQRHTRNVLFVQTLFARYLKWLRVLQLSVNKKRGPLKEPGIRMQYRMLLRRDKRIFEKQSMDSCLCSGIVVQTSRKSTFLFRSTICGVRGPDSIGCLGLASGRTILQCLGTGSKSCPLG